MAVLDDVVASQTFRLLTPAPAEAVWSALTCPQRTTRYLHMSLRSSWRPGAPVQFVAGDRQVSSGQVLCLLPPNQLSYSIEDDSGATAYVTWLVRPVEAGCVVRLQVSETDCRGTTEDELEDVWLPVVEALRVVLAAERPR